MIALLIIAYVAIALLCVYAEARLTGEAALTPMWIVWPFLLPILAVAFTFHRIGQIGEDHHDA